MVAPIVRLDVRYARHRVSARAMEARLSRLRDEAIKRALSPVT
jgi:hypothetical protein